MAFLRRFKFDPYSYARTLAHGPRARAWVWGAGLASMLGSQLVLPCAQVCAQMRLPQMNGLQLGDGPTQSTQLGDGPNAPSITKIGSGNTQHLKVKPSATTGCGPGSNCDVTTKPLDLSRTPTEKELRMAGQMGGALSPLFPADVPVWQQKFDDDLKKEGVPHGLSQQVAPPGAPQDDMSRAVNGKRAQIERLKKMNLDFGTAMQQWNKHEYRAAADKLQEYIKTYPESPWAGEAALHLGCDAKYNGRFNEAQTRLEEIVSKTSEDPKDPSWEIHQKAKLRWADLDIGLGRLNGASDKIANMLMTEKDWRRKSWERYWFRSVNADKRDSRVLRACGTKALGFVLASLGKKDRADALNRMTPTRQAGFSLAELSQLSVKNGAPMQGFRASVAQLASVPLPFIIHYDFGDAKRAAFKKARGSFWPTAQPSAAAFPAPAMLRETPQSLKRRALVDAPFKATEEAGHFLVVNAVDAKTGRVHMFDPQEGRHYTLSFNQMQSEWSGVGLRLASAPHQVEKSEGVKGLPRLSMLEMKKYVGGCCGVARAPSDLGPSGSGGGPGGHGGPCGSPVWSVNPVSLNVNIHDIPLWYDTPIGPNVEISMSYNAQDSLNQNSTLGNKWSFGYGSYLVEDTGDGGGVVTVFMPLGGEDNYLPQDNNTYKADHSDNLNKLRKVGDHRFELLLLDGTKYIYDIPAGAHSLQPFLVEQRDKFGYSLTFGYDGDNRMRTITDAQGKVTQLFYDGYGHLIRARTPQGREATWDYDVNGNMVQTVDIEGNPFGYVYDSEIRITELVTVQGSWEFNLQGPDGNPTGGFVYPAPGAPTWEDIKVTIKDPNNGIQEFFYDGGGSPFPGSTDGSLPKYWHVSPRFYHAYVNAGDNNSNMNIPREMWEAVAGANGIGHVTAVAQPTTDGGVSAPVTRTEFDPITGWPISITDSRGRKTLMTYNAVGRVTSITDRQNRTSRFEYAPNGLDVTRTIDWRGNVVSEMTYSGLGQIASINIPASNPGDSARHTSFTYTPWGMPLTVLTAQGLTSFTYDSNCNVASTSRNGVETGTMSYDDQGRLISINDADGQTAGYSYDELNHLRKVTYSDGSSTETDAVCCGMPGAVKDRAGRWTYYDYDALKRPIRIQDAAGNTLQVDYDADGNRARLIDAKGTGTAISYDSRNRPIVKTYSDGTTTRFSYDQFGRIIASQNGRGQVTRYKYDSNDNLSGVDFPNMPDITYGYDDKQRPIRVTDSVGTTRFRYDDLDRLISVDGPFDSDTVTYSYDSLGRRASTSVDGVSSSGGNQTTYDYDGTGRLDSLTSQSGVFNYVYTGIDTQLSELQMPNGSKAIFGYDGLKRLDSVENKKASGEVISQYSYAYERENSSGNYQKTGLRTGVDLQLAGLAGTAGAGVLDPAQHTDYAYSTDSQLTGETTAQIGPGSTSTPLWNRSYGYDAMENRLATSDLQENGDTHSLTYTPNALNQLTALSSTKTSGGVTTSSVAAFTYDTAGNLTDRAFSSGGTGAGHTSYHYDELNRLVETVGYNAAGDPQTKIDFSYDAFSRKRVAKTFNWADDSWNQTAEKRYVYDGRNVVQERDGDNAVTASYTWGGTVGGLLSRRTFSGGEATGTYFYHYDGTGNVTGLTDASQDVVARYRYDAFGKTLEASGPQESQPFRFSTKELVAGLYDYGLRFYDPALGRFINRDPIEETGGTNLYGFVGNNPVNGIDAWGLCVTPLQLALIFGVALGATLLAPVTLPTVLIASAAAGVAFGVGNAMVNGGPIDPVHDAMMGGAAGGAGWAIAPFVAPYVGLAATGAGGAAANELEEESAQVASTGGGCFVKGTPILMADGSSKFIELVQKGDQVLSKDEKSGKVESKTVESAYKRHHVVTREMTFADGSTVETTDEHPLYVEGQGFVKAKEIGLGSSIVTRAGPGIKLTGNRSTGLVTDVYNLNVADFHSYFVGNGQLWVHNIDPADCPPEWVFRDDTRSPDEIFENGFKSKGDDMDLMSHVAGNYLNSGYVATSKIIDEEASGNLYVIKNPGGIDVNAAIPSNPNAEEMEIAVPRFISPSAVRAVRDGDVFHLNPNWRP